MSTRKNLKSLIRMFPVLAPLALTACGNADLIGTCIEDRGETLLVTNVRGTQVTVESAWSADTPQATYHVEYVRSLATKDCPVR